MPTEARLHVSPDAEPIVLTGAFGELRAAAPTGPALVDGREVEAAVQQAMAEPVGLPPLAQCFTEDDRVAVALGVGVPRVDAVLRGLLGGLAEANISADQVTIVTAGEEPTLAEGLADAIADGLQVVAHNPADDENLCFAGVDERDEPLRISRPLFEADVLLPLTCAHAPDHPAAHGAFGDLFPAFGDAGAIRRLSTDKGRRQHSDDADRAGWVLGSLITVQVVPGDGGSVSAVFSGEAQHVHKEASASSDQQWSATVDSPATLIVVTLGGEPERQTWQRLGGALDTAARLATPDAAVALITQLGQAPPQALIELAEADDTDHALHRLHSKKDADLPLAQAVAEALNRGPLYLMSRLDADDVESLGMAPLATTDELQRLVASRPSVLLLTDAEHRVASFTGEAAAAEVARA